MTKFYFAGKIDKHDWRHSICKGLRNEGFADNTKTRVSTVKLENGHEYVGPWFVGCDHGCAHGPTKHGALDGCDMNGWLEEQIDYIDNHGGHTIYPRKYIKNACLLGIKRCDVVFAWIDSADCYGTLAEIGYAHAMNKQIWIVYSNKFMCEIIKSPGQSGGFEYVNGGVEFKSQYTRTHEMWFIDEMANRVKFADYPDMMFHEMCLNRD